MLDNNTKTFLALLRAGLWGEADTNLNLNANDNHFEGVEWEKVYQLAQEQSVQGVVLQGIEAVQGLWLKAHGSSLVPQMLLLQWIGNVQVIEQRNKAMNQFVAELVEKMRTADIYAILVKGQGVAQCYEKPLWRPSGDVDLLLSEVNFLKARDFLRPLVANGFNPSIEDARNISAQLPPWDIELHANQYCGLSQRMDAGIKEVQKSIIIDGQVRSWMNGRSLVFLPSTDNDVIFIFTHFLKHFYKGGLGLRQICDWCRLLWTYKDSLNIGLLESRLRRMGLMTEWKAFGAFAVDYLGMPIDSMPFYSQQKKWSRKANVICSFILEVGNMGHSRDLRFYGNKSFIRRKIGAFGVRVGDLFRHARLFPLDSIRFFPSIVFNGVRSAIKGVG